jgi:hypothetical protein
MIHMAKQISDKVDLAWLQNFAIKLEQSGENGRILLKLMFPDSPLIYLDNILQRKVVLSGTKNASKAFVDQLQDSI